MEYLPFGELLVDEHFNSYNTPFKFNGKELDEETGNYYYGARYYNPKTSIWLSVDPLADMYPGRSSYEFSGSNPIINIDSNGMFWKPSIDDDCNVNYIAEEGDSAATLQQQYGLKKGQAEAMLGGQEVVAGETTISGSKAKEVTGSEVMKLDLNSKMSTEQRVWDQFSFGAKYESSQGNDFLYTGDYYSNIFMGSSAYSNTGSIGGNSAKTGHANITLDNGSVEKIYYSLRLDAGTSLYDGQRAQYILIPSARTVTRTIDGQTKNIYYLKNYATIPQTNNGKFGKTEKYRRNGYSEIFYLNSNINLPKPF